MEKKTKKEMWFSILKIKEVADNEDLVAFINREIDALDKKAEKAKERAAKKAEESDSLREKIYSVLTEIASSDFVPIADIVAAIGEEDITPAKVTARLTKLVEAGRAEKQEISLESGTGTKRRVQGYRVITE